MPTEIIDLDELVAAPKKVKLRDTVYTLPAELPVETYLRLRAAEQAAAAAQEAGEDTDENERIEELHDLLLQLFREYQPELEALPGGLVQLFSIIPRVYGAKSGEEDDADPKPAKTRARTGNATTRSQKQSRSRS